MLNEGTCHMKYVHYWHFQKAWYADVNANPNPERIGWHDSARIQKHWNEKYLIENSACLTRGEVKKKLFAMYPGCILVKDRPYHQGARWHGFKGGSREGVFGLHKKPIKEKNVSKQVCTETQQED